MGEGDRFYPALAVGEGNLIPCRHVFPSLALDSF